MKKFTRVFKFPCQFQSNTWQAEEWKNATPESNPEYFGKSLVCVSDEGRIFTKNPKHYIGVLSQRARGGKWEELQLKEKYKGVYLSTLTPAEFKGQPRIKKQS